MNKYRQSLGKCGENYALEYLEGKDYSIIARNLRIGRGEIDIIAKWKNLFVFVEVKTRKDDSYVDILDSISVHQEETLIRSCELYLAQNRKRNVDYRIDLIGIVIKHGIVRKFEHIQGIL